MPTALAPALPTDWPFSGEWGTTRYFAARKYLAERRPPIPDFRATLRARWAETPPTVREEKIMGRLLTAIPTNAPVSVTVPEDVAKELDELYAYMVQHPEFMAQATFTKDDDETPDTDAATVFMAQAKEWGRVHEPVLEVRKSPSRTLPDHVIRFNIRPPLTPEEVAANAAKNKAAAEKRDAAKALAAKGTKSK